MPRGKAVLVGVMNRKRAAEDHQGMSGPRLETP